ncbi:hypothetical protein ACODT3_21650 [Streptomyces sp. 4.24]|uniref:hypothetical protein n=1 Tax=Streptomyces tritrimontium TaxID=3406573 RepID=UPI003BB52752
MRATFRTAAVAAGAMTALLLPAAQTSAAEAPAPTETSATDDTSGEGPLFIAGGAALAAVGAAGLGISTLRRHRTAH